MDYLAGNVQLVIAIFGGIFLIILGMCDILIICLSGLE